MAYIAPGLEVIKVFFMLNSAKHEICPASKSLNLLTIANSLLLYIAEHEIFSAKKYYCWHFHIY